MIDYFFKIILFIISFQVGALVPKILIIDGSQNEDSKYDALRGIYVALQENNILTQSDVSLLHKNRSVQNKYINITTRIITNNEIDWGNKKLFFLLKNEIEKNNPDLIMVSGIKTIELIGKEYADTGFPIIIYNMSGNPLKFNFIDTINYPGHNVTGSFYNEPVNETFNITKNIFKRFNSVTYIYDNSYISSIQREMIEKINIKDKNVLLEQMFIPTSDDLSVENIISSNYKYTDVFFILGNIKLSPNFNFYKYNKPIVSINNKINQDKNSILVKTKHFSVGRDAGIIAIDTLLNGVDISELSLKESKSIDVKVYYKYLDNIPLNIGKIKEKWVVPKK